MLRMLYSWVRVMGVCGSVCADVYAYVYTYSYVFACICRCVYVCVCVFLCLYICLFDCMHVCNTAYVWRLENVGPCCRTLLLIQLHAVAVHHVQITFWAGYRMEDSLPSELPDLYLTLFGRYPWAQILGFSGMWPLTFASASSPDPNYPLMIL